MTDDWTGYILLQKGLEEEVYTGTPDGEVVGLSRQVSEALEDFHCEPDARNTEYATVPYRDYSELGKAILRKRRELRDYIRTLGDYTLIPGGVLPISGADQFVRSKPEEPYHSYIEKTYGSHVVTASTHINIGVHDPETALRAYRVIRAEAALYLALTATSPFLNNEVTDFHSVRWHRFPMTPSRVPYFRDHAHYVAWMHEQLELGSMFNPRHLWLSTRPNGHHPPEQVHRLELRICDRIDDPYMMLAVTGLLEARTRQLIEDPGMDPLTQSPFSAEELEEVDAENNRRVSRHSLEASFIRWQDGREVPVRERLAEYLERARIIGAQRGFADFLLPLEQILDRGNIAMRWLAQYRNGASVEDIIREAIVQVEIHEQECARYECCMHGA